MYHLTICRKLSLINAAKCNKAVSFEIAIQSSEKLKSLFDELLNIVQNESDEFNNKIQVWMNTYPIVSENEINQLLIN